jgi:hypothetical protein
MMRRESPGRTLAMNQQGFDFAVHQMLFYLVNVVRNIVDDVLSKEN